MPELLDYWIREREFIRRSKEAGAAKPWSKDPVFQKTYFCNVHREDDRVTRWIRKTYTPEYFGSQYEVAILASRIFNKPETLLLLGHPIKYGDYGGVKNILEDLQHEGSKIWSGAYVITTHGRKMPKIDYCVEILEAAAAKLPLTNVVTCEGYWLELQELEGFGSFLAAQVVADLKNTENHWMSEAPDWTTFSAPGPGSVRGLSWYFDTKVTYRTYQEYIDQVWDEQWWDLRDRGCMQDLQNCMCEFDKYCRVLTGTGRSKRNYPGLA